MNQKAEEIIAAVKRVDQETLGGVIRFDEKVFLMSYGILHDMPELFVENCRWA